MTLVLNIEPRKLTVEAIDALTASIQEQVLTLVNPGSYPAVEAYDVFKALERATRQAMPEIICQEALKQAEECHQQLGCNGAEVIINGVPHQVKHKAIYDFTHKRSWIAKQRLVVKAEAALKAAKVQLAGVEDSLRLCNKPDHIETTLAFTPFDA